MRSTGTAPGIKMSPDLPVLRVKVWLARLLSELVYKAYDEIFTTFFLVYLCPTVYQSTELERNQCRFDAILLGGPRLVAAIA